MIRSGGATSSPRAIGNNDQTSDNLAVQPSRHAEVGDSRVLGQTPGAIISSIWGDSEIAPRARHNLRWNFIF